MSEIENTQTENDLLNQLVYTDYRATALELGTAFLALAVLLLGLVPNMFDLGSEMVATVSAAAGVVLAGLVIWVSHSLLAQDRGLDLAGRKVVEFTYLKKWSGLTGVRVLADFDDIAAVYLNPKVNLWSPHHEWLYPVAVLTKDGRSLTLSNQATAFDRENYAIPTATQFGELLGCDVYLPDERTPVKIVRRGQEFSLEPKKQDVGLLGRFIALSAVVLLVWGLWKLATLV